MPLFKGVILRRKIDRDYLYAELILNSIERWNLQRTGRSTHEGEVKRDHISLLLG